eukprot:6728990-Pyramimonas_sp.AAC.1
MLRTLSDLQPTGRLCPKCCGPMTPKGLQDTGGVSGACRLGALKSMFRSGPCLNKTAASGPPEHGTTANSL